MDLTQIENYFIARDEISMAFVFGSVAAGSQRHESDLDLAIYFKTRHGEIEWESDARYPTEDQIWGDLERMAGREIDLLVLNRAPATICDTVLREGKPLLIRERKTYLDMLLKVSIEAEDYRNFIEEFWKLKYA